MEHRFTTECTVPANRDEVFAFFSDAANLARITPPSLGFRILTPSPIAMREGTLIDYRIHLHGIPMKWRTLISRWNPPHEFADEQLRGPYRTWIHTHRFEALENGHTLMRDDVRYSLPFAPFSAVALPFVRREIAGIFEFRKRVIQEIFGTAP